jgi:hypothetical protein
MNILKQIENIYQYSLDNVVDVEDDGCDEVFNNIVILSKDIMKDEISEKEIQKLLYFLSDKNDDISDTILNLLLCNPSFINHIDVNTKYLSEIEDKMFDDMEYFNLSGDKLKIVDFFLNRNISEMIPLFDTLEEAGKLNILMYILEHAYEKEILDTECELGAFLSENSILVKKAYGEMDPYIEY